MGQRRHPLDAALADELSTLLGLNVDFATADLLRDHIREQALREAVPL